MVESQERHPSYSFSAGPCCLPKAVLQKARAEMLDYRGTGHSVMELSHRDPMFVAIADKARSDLKKLLAVPDNYTILMINGGASLQFSAICYNLLGDGDKQRANYLQTGHWSQLAFDEARKYCDPNEVANAKQQDYTKLIDSSKWNVVQNSKYFHYCDNETIQGFEFNDFPFEKVPEGQTLVCDMSSNICSKPIDWSKYGVVYASAQKNVGPAGVTFVIARNDLISAHRSDTPYLCEWERQLKGQNMFWNTPCCWSIYVCGLNIQHMLEQGGIPKMQANAIERSRMLYDYIDSSGGYYTNTVDEKYRSRINVPFRVCKNKTLEAKFVAEATQAGLIGLKGHVTAGGCRASLYNAMPIDGVRALIDFMAKFKAENPLPAKL